jgi:hypothetical protein
MDEWNSLLQYAPHHGWKCSRVGCATITSNWFEEKWLCTGLAKPDSPEESKDARKTLTDLRIVEPSTLSVALICPTHIPEILLTLAEHQASVAETENKVEIDTATSTSDVPC